jgi:hypothetical protein
MQEHENELSTPNQHQKLMNPAEIMLRIKMDKFKKIG